MVLSHLFTLFRTYTEMREKYQQLRVLPYDGHPYVIHHNQNGQYFCFVGSAHTTDLSHPQWDVIACKWQEFINNPNINKIVFYEGNSINPGGNNDKEAITKGADSGYAHWLADKYKIESLSPEPDRQEEVYELLASGISQEDLLFYYIGRQIAQWHRYDKNKHTDLQEYIVQTLSRYNTLQWPRTIEINEFNELFQSKYGMPPKDAPRSLLSSIDDPGINPIASACSSVRDRSIFRAIHTSCTEGRDVFAVFGSGHAIVMENALKKLYSR